MICTHPDCTGVHDNNRWSELCPRSRAAKRIKDQRYIHNEEITGGRLTKGFVVMQHRERMAFIRRCLGSYGGDRAAELLGDGWADRETSYWEKELAGEIEKFRARRDGHRSTRRKVDTICMGPSGLITEQMVIAATQNLSLRTYYR